MATVTQTASFVQLVPAGAPNECAQIPDYRIELSNTFPSATFDGSGARYTLQCSYNSPNRGVGQCTYDQTGAVTYSYFDNWCAAIARRALTSRSPTQITPQQTVPRPLCFVNCASDPALAR